MSYDPNQPPDSGQQPQQPPYGQPQPPFGLPGQPQSPYEQQWGQQPPSQYGQPPYGQSQQPPSQQQWGQQPLQNYAPTQYGAPAYGTQPVPGYMPPQQPRRSTRRYWIVLGIIGGLIVCGCGGCGILFAVSSNDYNSKEAASAMIVKQYYDAVKKRDYSTAFSYIGPNLTAQNGQPLTQEQYTTAAQGLDSGEGPVTNYSVGNISRDDYDVWSVTVTVTRGSNPVYDVQLLLKQINGTWKIISFDKI